MTVTNSPCSDFEVDAAQHPGLPGAGLVTAFDVFQLNHLVSDLHYS